jgi:hypothetical protein
MSSDGKQSISTDQIRGLLSGESHQILIQIANYLKTIESIKKQLDNQGDKE